MADDVRELARQRYLDLIKRRQAQVNEENSRAIMERKAYEQELLRQRSEEKRAQKASSSARKWGAIGTGLGAGIGGAIGILGGPMGVAAGASIGGALGGLGGSLAARNRFGNEQAYNAAYQVPQMIGQGAQLYGASQPRQGVLGGSQNTADAYEEYNRVKGELTPEQRRAWLNALFGGTK